MTTLPAVQKIQQEPMARFCPGCGSVGVVEDKFRDCCPDGSKARVIPESLANECHNLFNLALANSLQSAPVPVIAPLAGLEHMQALAEWSTANTPQREKHAFLDGWDAAMKAARTGPDISAPVAQVIAQGERDNTQVICPECTHHFRAIPEQVQWLMLDAGFEPPFYAAPTKSEETSKQAARFAIDGAIQYGRMGINPPPDADHWLAEYWNIGRALVAVAQPIANDAQDAARYRILRWHVAPAELAERMRLPIQNLRENESIEERIDALCDAAMNSSQGKEGQS